MKIPSCLARHTNDELIALAGRIVEGNLSAEAVMADAGDFFAAAYHADTAERWALIAFAASIEQHGRPHG